MVMILSGTLLHWGSLLDAHSHGDAHSSLLEVHSSDFHGDAILSLPGQPQVHFQQFSGYVQVDDEDPRALFYYFVESVNDSASKPLVLWLNGGRFFIFFIQMPENIGYKSSVYSIHYSN